MRLRVFLIAPILIASLAGCVTSHQRYDWGTYDPSLYAYYKDPTKAAAFAESLAEIISTADSDHAQIPPGIYAEYGYLQLQEGKNSAAVELFKQEETHWPESKVFMDRMIKVASTPTGPSSTK
jgi:hypothetical protein